MTIFNTVFVLISTIHVVVGDDMCYQCLYAKSYSNELRTAIEDAALPGRYTEDCETNVVGGVSTVCTKSTGSCATTHVTGDWAIDGITGDAEIIGRGCTELTGASMCGDMADMPGASEVITDVVQGLVFNSGNEQGCTCDAANCNHEEIELNRMSCRECFHVEGSIISGSDPDCQDDAPNAGSLEQCELNEKCVQALITDGTVTPSGGTANTAIIYARGCGEEGQEECPLLGEDTMAAENIAERVMTDSVDDVTANHGEVCACVQPNDCNTSPMAATACHRCAYADNETVNDAIGEDLNNNLECATGLDDTVGITCSTGNMCGQARLEALYSGEEFSLIATTVYARDCVHDGQQCTDDDLPDDEALALYLVSSLLPEFIINDVEEGRQCACVDELCNGDALMPETTTATITTPTTTDRDGGSESLAGYTSYIVVMVPYLAYILSQLI